MKFRIIKDDLHKVETYHVQYKIFSRKISSLEISPLSISLQNISLGVLGYCVLYKKVPLSMFEFPSALRQTAVT
jgi:hypothetical protein